MKHIIYILLLFVFLTTSVYAKNVTLGWKKSERAEGYTVWYGNENLPEGKSGPTDYQFPYKKSVEGGDTEELEIKNIPPGTWYFAATAWNEYGESPYSNVVSTTIDAFVPLEDTQPQVIDVPLAPGGVIQINISVEGK